MTQTEMIEKLRNEANTNPAAKAIFILWGMRERARHNVTIHSLSQTMNREGFTFPKTTYEAFLRFLSTLGLGTLQTNSKGRVVALTGIKTALQSIGKVASGQGNIFKATKRKNRFQHVTTEVVDRRAPQALPQRATVESKIVLTVLINGKPINFQVPPDLTGEEVATLLNRFKEGPSV